MLRFSEYVSLGHPDKVADYISQYLLDRYIERDPDTRYAVEVQIKNFRVVLGGEVASRVQFTGAEIQQFVRDAVNEIGYTMEYMQRWGAENTICGDLLQVESLIGQQSRDIAQGLSGWGDQGIFFGYAEPNPETHDMPVDHTHAKRLCKALFDSGLCGLDIKTQVVMDDDRVVKVIVAAPLLNGKAGIKKLRPIIKSTVKGHYEMIINGTGCYVQHSSIADCGTTGRKLAVDFYGGNCRIGGGSPWTKDASKADLTLNLCARQLARKYAKKYGVPVVASLACCIGKQVVDVSIRDLADNDMYHGEVLIVPADMREGFGLDKPIYASMCRWGLFGEFQADKVWELPFKETPKDEED